MLNQKINSLPYVLNFNNENSHIVLPDIDIDYSQGFTIEAWVYYNSFQYIPAIINFSNGKEDNIILMSRSTILTLYIKLQTLVKTLEVSNVIELDKWIHLAATVDSSGNGKLYKNGIEVKSGEIEFPPNLKRTINYIGRSTLTDNIFFDGRMAEVRFWKCSRTVEELQQNLHRRLEGNEPELVGYWPLNEGTGDVSNDGQIIDATWHQELYFPTDESNSFSNQQSILSFRGLTNYLKIKDPVFDDQEFTISLWVKPANLNDGHNYGLIGNNAPENQYYKLALWLTAEQSGLAYDSYDSIGNRFHEQLNDFFIARNQWVHITWVKEGTEYKFYRNGELFAAKPAPSSICINGQTNYWIGRSETFWNGQIAELSIWCRPRSQAEINADLYSHLTGEETDLVGYWPLDEGKGDKPTNKVIGKDGNIIGAVTWEKLNFKLYGLSRNRVINQDYALNFNGSDNYINCGNRINLANTSFSIEFWAKRNSTKAVAFIICQGIRQNHHGLHIGFRENDVFTLDFYGNGINTNASVTDTEWHHWCCVYDATTKNQIIYQDGKKITEGTATENYQGTGDLYIGSWVDNWGGSYFSGQITEVRIWEKARTEREITFYYQRRLIGNELGLIAYWPLNEGTGNIAHGKTNITNILTIHGATWEQKSTIIQAPNYIKSALEFDGVDDYVEIPPESIPTGNEITVSFWAKGDNSLPKKGSIILALSDNGNRILNAHLPWSNNRIYFDCGTDITQAKQNYDRIQKAAQPAEYKNEWTHWAFVKNAAIGEMKIYRNGLLWHSASNKKKPLPKTKTAKISSPYHYHGALAEFCIWDKAKTESEIQADMGKDLVGNEPNLLAYWPFNEGSGSVAGDKSIYARHATIHGATWQPQQAFAKPSAKQLQVKSVLNFQPDFVEIPEPFANNNEFTISLWVKPKVINDGIPYAVIGKETDQYCKPSLWLSPDNSALIYDSYDTEGNRYREVLVNFFLEQERWIHITWVKQGGNYKFYRHGELFATKPAPETFYSDKETGYCLGRVDNYSWVGEMANVSIWNIARTDTDIKNTINNRFTGKEPGLVGYWPLNDGSGTTIKDITSDGNDGKIQGSIWDWQVFFSNEKLPQSELEKQQNSERDTQLSELQQQNTEQDRKDAELAQKNQEQDTQLSQLQQQNDEQDRKDAQLAQKNQEQDTQLSQLQQQNVEQDRQLAELAQKNQEQDTQLSQLQQQNDEQDRQLAEIFQKLTELVQKNQEQDTQLSQLQKQNTQLKQKLQELSRKTVIHHHEWQQLQKLQPNDLQSESYFGEEAALSGEWAIAGARKADKAGIQDAGIAYIFQLENKMWVQKQQLQPDDTRIGDQFGSAVAINPQWAIIGARKADYGLIKNTGAAYIYQLLEGIWQPTQKLQPADLHTNSCFGKGIVINGDWGIIGAPYAKSTTSEYAGAAYVYHVENGLWEQKQKLQPQDLGINQCFGNVIAMGEEWAIIGGGDRYNSASIKRPGGAYIYRLENGIWQLKQKLNSPQPGINDLFGYSVAISGEYAFVGAVNTPVANILGTGTVYIYKLIEGVWQPQQTLQPTQPKYCAFFGATVAIANDIAVIGSTRADSSRLKDIGNAYIFQLEKGVWQLQSTLQPSDLHYESYFGFSTPINKDWIFTTAAWANNATSKRVGAVYVFASSSERGDEGMRG